LFFFLPSAAHWTCDCFLLKPRIAISKISLVSFFIFCYQVLLGMSIYLIGQPVADFVGLFLFEYPPQIRCVARRELTLFPPSDPNSLPSYHTSAHHDLRVSTSQLLGLVVYYLPKVMLLSSSALRSEAFIKALGSALVFFVFFCLLSIDAQTYFCWPFHCEGVLLFPFFIKFDCCPRTRSDRLYAIE